MPRLLDRGRDKSLAWLGAALCLAFLLPNHYSPWLSFHEELAAALAFLPLLAWACVQHRTAPALAIGAAALCLVPLFQMATGQLYFSGDGWLSFLYLLGFALAIHAGSCSVHQAAAPGEVRLTQLTALWVGLVFAAFVSVAIAAHQWLSLQKLGLFVADMPPNGRPFGNLAQPNHLATLLLLGVAGLMFLWESGKLHAASALAGAVLLIAGLVMSGSRSVLLTLVWLVPAYAWLRGRCALRTTPVAFALLVALYLLASVNWQALNEALLVASDASSVDRMSEPGIRRVYWASMLDAISRKLWIGYGWGQIGAAQTATALDYPPTHSFFDSSHNLVLDLALWSGVPVALLATSGMVLWFGWQVRRVSSPLAWVTLAAVGMVFSHAMVEYPLNSAYFLLPVGLWMGALSAANPTPIDRRLERWSGLSRRVAPIGGVAALLLFVAVVVEYLPYEEDWRLMRFQEARVGDLTPTPPPSSVVLTNLQELLRFARFKPRPHMPDQELEWMRRVSERYAYASLMYRYALAQGLNGQTEAAHLTLARLCRMHLPISCTEAWRNWQELAGNRPANPSTMTSP